MTPDKFYTEQYENPGAIPLSAVPVVEYGEFCAFIDRLMGEEGTHVVAYFAIPLPDRYRFICCMAADENHAILLLSHELAVAGEPALPSLTVRHPQFHLFEREIHENTGVMFDGHPWLKPVRFPVGTAVPMNDYPFFSMDGEALHEVGVGPVHAGIIEPGHFRFLCQGERVLHLEIQLGYQHRGVERLLAEETSGLRRALLAESIAGDTAIGHSLAFAGVMESLASVKVPERLSAERAVALEMERIAVHIGDMAALCNDVAYQFGQAVNEALRTGVINGMQTWCGNRFGKGLIRPGGTRYPLEPGTAAALLKMLDETGKRFFAARDRIFSLPSVLGRFEGTGILTPLQASLIGAVGPAARSSGMYRDIRWSHPFGAYRDLACEPAMLEKGDVWSRAMIRALEIGKSLEIIRGLLGGYPSGTDNRNGTPDTGPVPLPSFDSPLAPSSVAWSLTEGWRGEICHMAITDESGRIRHYKVKDPSFHNWTALAIAVRNQEISDFPLCNKSFNLSYCGHDL